MPVIRAHGASFFVWYFDFWWVQNAKKLSLTLKRLVTITRVGQKSRPPRFLLPELFTYFGI